jgi:hypothetical protein
MNVRIVTTFVIAVATIGLVQVPSLAQSQVAQVESITDPVAYDVYATALPATWATDMLLVQRETEGIAPVSGCLTSSGIADSEWAMVAANFKEANASVRVLDRTLSLNIPYRLIPRADILADDARLALKYPGMWQIRPESMEYAAMSAVGFNPLKNKAIVYVRLRSSGQVHFRELREGKWVATTRGVCGWAG